MFAASVRMVDRRVILLRAKPMEKKHAFLAAAAIVTVALSLLATKPWSGVSTQGSAFRREAQAAGAADARSVHVLLLGSDDGRLDGNTDTIILASVNPRRRTVYMMSIPRDSRVEIPGRRGHHKINVAGPLGGPGLTVATVENLLGTWVDYYVVVDFKGAARVIDRLGGVTIKVPYRMDYDDPVQDLHIHLRPGRQHLNGKEAVNFMRYRKNDPLGDVGRTVRQRWLLQEMARQLMASATLDRIPGLVPELWRTVRTNASVADAIRLASWFRGGGWTVVSATLPGNFQTIDGISYWGVDPDRARLAWAELTDHGRVLPLLDAEVASVATGAPRRRAAKPEATPSPEAAPAPGATPSHEGGAPGESATLGAQPGAGAPATTSPTVDGAVYAEAPDAGTPPPVGSPEETAPATAESPAASGMPGRPPEHQPGRAADTDVQATP